MIMRIILYIAGLAIMFSIGKTNYDSLIDYLPAILFGALIMYVLLVLSLLPGIGERLLKRQIIYRVMTFGTSAGLVLWLFLLIAGKPATGGIINNILVLIEFMVGYALLGLLLSVPSLFSRTKHQ